MKAYRHGTYLTKRVFDILVALSVLLLASPFLLGSLLAVWLQDWKSPIYKAPRAARGGGSFMMLKVRSMVVGADRSGVESTSARDVRITAVGHFVRRWKIDELPQLWNILRGEMSLVGPRPNTLGAIAAYSEAERGLLEARPGITDLSSIVFSDEGEILKDEADPDAGYDRLIRPWKSQLGLVYVEHAGLLLDLRLIWLTALAIFDRSRALRGVVRILRDFDADARLIEAASRVVPLSELAAAPLSDAGRTRAPVRAEA